MQVVTQPFENRREAGRSLAARLTRYAGRADTIVLGVPRGGMPVAYEVALALNAPLDVYVVRKIVAPGQKELALGAVAPGGVTALNQDVVRALQAPGKVIQALAETERAILARREAAYRAGRAAPRLAGKTVILVDDRLSSGATLRAAASSLRALGPARIVAAIPVAAPDACWAVRYDVDELIYAIAPSGYHSVSSWYLDFPATSDEEVRRMVAACGGGTKDERRRTEERDAGELEERQTATLTRTLGAAKVFDRL